MPGRGDLSGLWEREKFGSLDTILTEPAGPCGRSSGTVCAEAGSQLAGGSFRTTRAVACSANFAGVVAGSWLAAADPRVASSARSRTQSPVVSVQMLEHRDCSSADGREALDRRRHEDGVVPGA